MRILLFEGIARLLGLDGPNFSNRIPGPPNTFEMHNLNCYTHTHAPAVVTCHAAQAQGVNSKCKAARRVQSIVFSSFVNGGMSDDSANSSVVIDTFDFPVHSCLNRPSDF